jgi:hypothetical protein
VEVGAVPVGDDWKIAHLYLYAKFAYRHVRDWKGGTSAQELMYLAVAFAALTYVKVI